MPLSHPPRTPSATGATVDKKARSDAEGEHWLRRFLTRRLAPFIALLPILVAVAAIFALGDGERAGQPTDALPSGSGAARATALAAELPEDDALAAVVFKAGSGQLDDAALRELRTLAGELGATTSGGAPAVTVAADGTAALAFVPVEAASPAESTAAIEQLRDRLADRAPANVEALVTGPAAVQADLEAVFEGADLRLLGATAGIVALLLIITYRSPVLFVIPLLVVGIADRLATVLATQALTGLGVAFDDATTGILSILVFGAGTDYALLLISRYRAELARHESRYVAMAVALRRTAEAVLSSAVTVVLGVLTLLLSLTPTTRGLGLASAIGITVAAVFALVVLPAALVSFGRWVFWPRIPRLAPYAGGTDEADGQGSEQGAKPTVWSRIGRIVSRRPRLIVAGSLTLIAVLATGLLSVRTGLDEADQFIDKPEAIVAAEQIGKSFPAGAADPAQVVTRADGNTVLQAVTRVDGLATARITGQGDRVTSVEAVLEAPAGSEQAKNTIVALRAALADYPDTYVTGTEAVALDKTEGGQRDLLVIIPLVVLLVLLTLAALLRSVVAPVVLVATVVLTYAAALGASWWVFTEVFGFPALDLNVPLFAFVFLVALGVDYNIFLVTRAREEAAVHGSRQGMLRALAATGGVITSAGILLAAVFTVLGLLPAVALAQIGVVICIGVLLDTLLVRTVLVPALALLLGDRFWWPRTVAQPGTSNDVHHPTAAPSAVDLTAVERISR